MNWKSYSHLRGTHAFLSPSKYHWLNYSSEKLITAYENHRRIKLGTRYHKVAEELISLYIRLPNTADSLNSFVNDAIGYRMRPEVVLYYSMNCYGTVDAISFDNGVLRIHDLKTGKTPASMQQLLVYAALFVLDYSIDLRELKKVILRIYQNGEIFEAKPEPSEIMYVADQIKHADQLINDLLGE
jgi:hypothetical protein